MAGILSKRQQARNEKALQELIHNVPGNDHCADCQARNPAWASWNLGIFLCMRCAAIHRKLGTHISKVKSLSMDSWTNEQVENMRKVGNIKSNELNNPESKRPHLPIDAEEADSVMERYIRKKYASTPVPPRQSQLRELASEDELPPPLPPKSPTSARITLRSASNIFPLSSKAKREAAAATIRADTAATPRTASPARHANKPSQVFGATVEYDRNDDTDRKLARLRDMGFTDLQRNAMVLKSVGGSLDRAVETLVRLAEGDSGRSSMALPSPVSMASPAPAADSTFRSAQSLTPASSGTSHAVRAMSRDGPSTPSTVSSNPFDMLPPQPQSSQSTGTLQNKNPYQQQPNQQEIINQAFGNMSLAAPSQPLFPNHTGGFPAPHLASQPPYQQSMTPPVPSQPYVSPYGGLQQFQPQLQPLQQQHTANPFYNYQGQGQVHGLGLQQAPQPQQNLSVNTNGINNANNPFARSPTTRLQSPQLGQIPEQSQLAYYSQPQYLQQHHTGQPTNPFANMQQSQQQQQQQQPQQFQQPQQLQQPQYSQYQAAQMYTPQVPDKASIMALYNYPHLAPRPQDPAAAAAIHVPAPAQQPRSVSTPLPGSNNPFAATPVASGMTNGFAGDGSAHKHQPQRDSVAIGMEMAWNNGRHSPDAFASLSARHG